MADHYETLGVGKDASKEEIKAAFRRCALDFHPDRHSHSPPSVRNRAVKRFKQASEAYEVLLDDSLRAHYDRAGYRGGGGSYYGYGGGSSYGYGGGSSYGYGGGSSYGYGGGSYYGYGGGSHGSGGGARYGAAAGRRRVEWDAIFKYLSSRRFALNLLLASCFLGGTIVIEKSGEAIWKMNNSGKSFEAAVESLEKTKSQKDDG